MTCILLRGGVVLLHNDDDHITPTAADILVKGDRISAISRSIVPPPGCNILDCTDRIIAPGFVDAHHHMWQTFMKGLFADSTFVQYMQVMYTASLSITPEDLFWSNLAGSMEAIDAGTTTTLDHAHMNWAQHNSEQAIAGTLSSGIRSIFAYSPTLSLAQTQPVIEFASDPMPDWVMSTFEKLAQSNPLNDPASRVRLGLGFDFYFLPKAVVLAIFDKAKSLGVQINTSHYFRPHGEKSDSLPALLSSYGILDESILLSHAGGATTEDAKLLSQGNTFVAVTANSEQSMTVGPSFAFRDDLPGMERLCCLGTDSHSITSSSMVNEMRTALQYARGIDSAQKQSNGVIQKQMHHTTAEVFNMATINGARALRLAHEVGSIAVGKKADLVVFNSLSPAMVGAAQQDPVAAIVMHSSIGDIDTVIIDGEIRKQNGKLLSVKEVAYAEGFGETGRTIMWREVAAKVLDTQRRFVSKLQTYDLAAIGSTAAALFQLPEAE